MSKPKTKTEELAANISAQTIASLFEEKIMMSSPKAYVQKTEKLSGTTKQAHDALYRRYIEDFNKIQLELQSASRTTNFLALRSLYQNRNFLLNAIKLHELYFANISDLRSEISDSSYAYTKLSECYGTFEAWQEDFIAVCLTSREGWGITYFDPYLKTFTNCVIDLHDLSVPIGCIPIIVMDMWSHAYFHDYGTDKKSYVYNMLGELNWDVIEGRIEAILASNINTVFALKPIAQTTNTIATTTAVNFEQMPVTATTPGTEGAKDVQQNQIHTTVPTDYPNTPMFESDLNGLEKKLKKIVLK